MRPHHFNQESDDEQHTYQEKQNSHHGFVEFGTGEKIGSLP